MFESLTGPCGEQIEFDFVLAELNFLMDWRDKLVIALADRLGMMTWHAARPAHSPRRVLVYCRNHFSANMAFEHVLVPLKKANVKYNVGKSPLRIHVLSEISLYFVSTLQATRGMSVDVALCDELVQDDIKQQLALVVW